jgi:hypothetical protein
VGYERRKTGAAVPLNSAAFTPETTGIDIKV